MIENAEKFFEKYNSDETLRERVRRAVEEYPGSLEIREALVENTLIPIARELGLEFTVADLRAYETREKMKRFAQDDEEYFASAEDNEGFWLLDNGWEYDEGVFGEAEGRGI